MILMSGMAFGQYTITVNGADYLVVEGRVNIGCVGQLTPIAEQPWEHLAIGAGFVRSSGRGNSAFYVKGTVGSPDRSTVSYFNGDFSVIDYTAGFRERRTQTLAGLFDLIY